MRFDGWKPAVSLSRSLKPLERPGDFGARVVEVADALERLDERVLEEDELALGAPLGELEDELLGARDELDRLALALPPELRDLAAGADQAAQRCRLLDDLGVVAGVRARRDEG